MPLLFGRSFNSSFYFICLLHNIVALEIYMTYIFHCCIVLSLHKSCVYCVWQSDVKSKRKKKLPDSNGLCYVTLFVSKMISILPLRTFWENDFHFIEWKWQITEMFTEIQIACMFFYSHPITFLSLLFVWSLKTEM